MPIAGVLALQGDFEAHQRVLAGLGLSSVQVRTAAGLAGCGGLIIPGGESTTMLKMIGYENLLEPLREFGRSKPVFGTCAGAILLAREVSNPVQVSLGLMDISVERNAYGRQVHSHVARIAIDEEEVEAVFIRAPVIRRVGPSTRVLARFEGTPVLVDDGLHMAATFHPELTSSDRVHRLFAARIR